MVKTETAKQKPQMEFDFFLSKPRPFLSGLPSRIDEYEARVTSFFHRKTGLDYCLIVDRVIDLVISTGGNNVVDMITDAAIFPLRLAKRDEFHGYIYSLDCNVTLIERAKQRAAQLRLQTPIEFRQWHEMQIPLAGGCADTVVSIFDLHRHPAKRYLAETIRILMPEGLLVLAEYTESKPSDLVRFWRRTRLRYIEKNREEAEIVYPDREHIIEWLFGVGFRQVVIQEMNVPNLLPLFCVLRNHSR